MSSILQSLCKKTSSIAIQAFDLIFVPVTFMELILKKVRDIPIPFLARWEENNILFIDASHVIKPRGGLFSEFLHFLQVWKEGVSIHIHDIFTPFHYSVTYLFDNFRLCIEQYLLEASLIFNMDLEIFCTMNFLRSYYTNDFYFVVPILEKDKEKTQGSFHKKLPNLSI